MSPPASAPKTNVYPSPRLGSLVYYAILMVTFLAASSAPTPLYQLYQTTWHFSTTWLTLVFASYVFALLLALLTTGSLSDYIGRRPVVAMAIVGELLSLVLFLVADGLAWVLAARILQGMATGIVTSALAAAMLDSDHTRGPVLASIAPLSGMGIGALFAGVLVAYAPAPMRLVYLILMVLLVVMGLWLTRIPESVTPRPGALAALRPRAHIPPAVRGPLFRVIPAVVSSWALGGFSLSLGPTLVERISGVHNPLVGCLITFLLPFIGGISVLTLRARPPRLAVLLGTACLIVGMLGLLLGVHQQSVAILLAGTAIAGIGFGAAFMGAMRVVMPLAPPTERSALMAAFYVICYLSASTLALCGGIATQHLGLIPTTYVYGSLVALLSLAAFVGTLTQRQPESRPRACSRTPA
ncbi:MFS transporter [Salinicola sp. LHM]|uniref:MFS transporter n=2 Tax=Salinicola TaxID=404432 RepID=UPI0008DD3A59|nr:MULTISPECIES: MFS transporter [unclassified Salinicola]OHZ02822.1 MFS transporter [Salinicola sp. MIT1003]WQH32757.1 MFS transporter [Salinicola sp. LHM]